MVYSIHSHGDKDTSRAPQGSGSSVALHIVFVNNVYERLAKVYVFVWGPAVQHGRRRALARREPKSGDRVLEVGVGTGISASLSPTDVDVVGIDFSCQMLERAHGRLKRQEISHVRLQQMDAAALDFPDHSFAVVFALYLISVVPDPVQVSNEMLRVCRPGGRLLIVNHFAHSGPVLTLLKMKRTPASIHSGFRLDLDLRCFLEDSSLQPEHIETVNFPQLWTLIVCRSE